MKTIEETLLNRTSVRRYEYDKIPSETLDFIYRALTSSSCHPKIFIKEFCNFLVPCHQHCLRVNVLVQR